MPGSAWTLSMTALSKGFTPRSGALGCQANGSPLGYSVLIGTVYKACPAHWAPLSILPMPGFLLRPSEAHTSPLPPIDVSGPTSPGCILLMDDAQLAPHCITSNLIRARGATLPASATPCSSKSSAAVINVLFTLAFRSLIKTLNKPGMCHSLTDFL